ncbi:CobW family GTP-binding protein [Chitinophaga vietnamensis]|uniref:CobW family GTP-binding protein n=1 Tax=Chitinophaga vietnamensis TaxID=2593957 RepID=UPI001177A1CF|nr:GTP-binding protein [Chitinophaga vietnamensis]
MGKVQPIRVYLLTGFLGAGKTTVLNRLLQLFRQERNIVIENEFGKVNIDTSLVSEKLDRMYELTSGCICCSLDQELFDVLNDVLLLEQRPHNLFIETTGIADAGSIVGMFHLPDVKKHFELVKTIAIADAENVIRRLEQVEETGKQLVAADLIVINKIHQLTVPELVVLQQQLQQINPLALITTSREGEISLRDLQAPNAAISKPSFAFRGVQQHKLNTVLFESAEAFDLNRLLFVLDFHFSVYPDQLYRIKGYVRIAGSEGRFLVQSTGKYLNIVPAGEWDGPPASVLVFIGRGLKTPAIQRILTPALQTGSLA